MKQKDDQHYKNNDQTFRRPKKMNKIIMRYKSLNFTKL